MLQSPTLGSRVGESDAQPFPHRFIPHLVSFAIGAIDPVTIIYANCTVVLVERPGIRLVGTLPVYVFAITEGTVWGIAAGLLLTGGFTRFTIGGAVLGGILGLVCTNWYLPQVRGEN